MTTIGELIEPTEETPSFDELKRFSRKLTVKDQAGNKVELEVIGSTWIDLDGEISTYEVEVEGNLCLIPLEKK